MFREINIDGKYLVRRMFVFDLEFSHFSHFNLEIWLASAASIFHFWEGAPIRELLVNGSYEEICRAGLSTLAASWDVLNIIQVASDGLVSIDFKEQA